MYKKYFTLIVLCFVCTLSLSLYAQEVEPNDTIANANPLALNVLVDAKLSVADTMDVWKINAETDKMYTISTVTNMLTFNAKNVLKMSVVDENDVSVLNADPSSRNDAFGAILRGWTPAKTGVYYVKVWGAPAKLAAEADPSYQMAFWYGTPLSVASTVHEPDNVVADAVNLPFAPVDGTMIHGYLYNDYVEADTFRTNWNDFDMYKIEVPEAGMILTAETFTAGRLYDHPEWIREVDTEIELLDATGTVTPINNDDKNAWAGDADYGTLSNTFSRMVTPPIPSAGTYYVRVNSYYNSVNRNENPHNSHRNAGGGEYLVSFRLVSANDPSLVAQTLPLNELKNGSIAVGDTMDVWGIYAETDKMYTISTVTNMLTFNAKNVLKMSVVDENNVSVLNADPSSRNDAFGAILRGWTPAKTGVYYVKVWGAPAKLAAEADPSYQMAFWYGTPLSVASTVHEPDNVVADAVNLPPAPVDGTMIHGYLYNDYVEADTFRTNWNDLDMYKVEVPEAGMILIAETFTAGRLYDHPEWIRDLDTEIELLDATGTVTPINNDDKNAWAGDADYGTLSNTFSRMVTPPIPSAGTYYVRVNSYYNSVNRNENPHNSHRNAGGGEYLVSFRLVSAGDPSLVAQTLPLNELKNGSIAVGDTMDVWGIYAETDKMYTISTVTNMLTFNAKNVLKMSVVDENNVSVLNADPSSRNDAFGAILRGWTPAKTGVYYVKVWGAPAKLAAEADPSYQMAFWYGTPLSVASTVHEPDNVVADAVNLPFAPVDGTMIHGYLYNDYVEADTFRTNWNDLDMYKIEVPEAGMILTAETFTAGRLYDHPEWIRDLDTEIELLDATGTVTPIENDDKEAWAGDADYGILSNTFSRFVSPPIPSAGTYYVRVNSYYNSVTRNENPHNSHRNAGGGEYLVSFTLTLPTEQEPNNDMASANLITLQTLTDATLAPEDSVDYYKFWADSTAMYTINTITPRGVNAKEVIHMDIFFSGDPTQSVLHGDPATRYKRWGVRVTGWVPPRTGFYYAKITGSVMEPMPYSFRLWYGTSLAVAAAVHEPDNTIEEADKFGTFAAEGSEQIHSYLYNHYVDSLGTVYNWNDFDLYKIEVAEGDSLIVETFTAGPDSCIRDTDTQVFVLDAAGNEVGVANDDKGFPGEGNWEELLLPDLSNSFSRIPQEPTGAIYAPAGTYYIRVNSIYNSILRASLPKDSDKDPGGGEYILKVDIISSSTGIENVDRVPLKFELAQNYPNPFNPTTTINYSTPKSGMVKLVVYNMLGEKVTELVNKNQQAGNYSVTWNAVDSNGRRMASGVYFYKLEAGSFVKVNKLILLK